MQRRTVGYILAWIGFFIIAGAFIFFIIDKQSTWGIILSGIGVVVLVIAGLTTVNFSGIKSVDTQERTPAISDEQRERMQEIYRRRVEEALKKAEGKKAEIELKDSIIAQPYEGKLKEDICMVCKLDLTDKDEILQCPICESLYHKKHLIEWITNKKKCPVCVTELYKNNT